MQAKAYSYKGGHLDYSMQIVVEHNINATSYALIYYAGIL